MIKVNLKENFIMSNFSTKSYSLNLLAFREQAPQAKREKYRKCSDYVNATYSWNAIEMTIGDTVT